MTIAFSISDMVSSISAKLGEENSTASSSSKQRQKIVQVFNSYSSGINDSISNLTDLFDKSVQKTNESRYQTAISQIDFEYSDFGTQLGDAFLAKEFSIRKENLKAKISQDYYLMLRDNRQSMQRAMIDVPNFGPNIMPSFFSHFFIDNPDRFHGLNSMQIWSALYSRGVIDQHGHLNANFDVSSQPLIDLGQPFPVLDTSESPEAERMNGLLHEQYFQFKANWGQLTYDDKVFFRDEIRKLLLRHKKTVSGASVSSGNGVRIVHAGMSGFDTSRHLFSVMDLMERESDSSHSMNVIFEPGFFDSMRSFDPNSVHNTFGSNVVTLESLEKYELYNHYRFPISRASSFFDYRDQIDAFLIDAYQNNREVVPSSYDFLPKDEREAFHQYLISASYIKKELNNQYYVVFSNDPTQSTQPAFPISHLERDLYNKQADIDKALIKLYQENRIASKDALSEKLTFFNDEQMTRLYAHLQDKGYIKNEIDGNPYVSLPSVGTYDQPVSKNDVFSVLKRHGVIDSNGHILDVSKLILAKLVDAILIGYFQEALRGSIR